MPFVGKPSRACRGCKARKVKCDTARPSCGQCLKTGRKCPGYLDDFSLVFRDETKAVVQHAERKRSKAASRNAIHDRTTSRSPSFVNPGAPPTPPAPIVTPEETQIVSYSSAWNEEGFPLSEQSPGFSIPKSLSQPYIDAAIVFYFRHIVEPASGSGNLHTFVRYCGPLYAETSIDSTLHKAVEAVALGVYSLYPERYSLQPRSRRLYTDALTAIRNDINDPVKVQRDETLGAVLLLAAYENLLSTDESVDAFRSHVDGGVSIIKIKGTKQFKSKRSLTMFRSVRNYMVTSCLRHGIPTHDIPNPAGHEQADDVEVEPSQQLVITVMALPNLIAECKEILLLPKTPESCLRMLNLISKTQEVDAMLALWHSRQLPWESANIEFISNHLPSNVLSADFWLGPVHSYSDLLIANVTLDYNIARIYAHKTILLASRYLAHDDENISLIATVQVAKQVIQEMVDNICYCVPFHISPVFQNQLKTEVDKAATRGLGAYLLVWPLQVAVSCSTIPDLQRNWIRGRLMHIKETFGLVRAAKAEVPG